MRFFRHKLKLPGRSLFVKLSCPNTNTGTIEVLKSSGLRDKVKIMIGGAPVTEEFANRIGADAFAPDASSATRIARQLAE